MISRVTCFRHNKVQICSHLSKKEGENNIHLYLLVLLSFVTKEWVNNKDEIAVTSMEGREGMGWRRQR